MLKEMLHFEIGAFDGAADDRWWRDNEAGRRQTGGRLMGKKEREWEGGGLHIYPASSGFALFLTFALACDNRAFKIKCMFLSK